MSDSTDIAVPKNICSPVCSAYSSLELGETLPVTKNPLLIYRIGERLAICEITGNDRGGGGGDDGGGGGGGMALAGAGSEAIQALIIRSSRQEQQINNLHLAFQETHGEQRNFIDSRFKVLNNNIRAMQGTVAGGFAIQNNGGQLQALNDPAAHLLNEVVHHARLTKNINLVMQLWQEYKVGLYGYKRTVYNG